MSLKKLISVKTAALSAASVLGLSLFLWPSQEVDSQGVAEVKTLPVATTAARYQNTYQAKRIFPGRVSAVRASETAFQVAGEVTDMFVDVGDRITQGSEIGRLDSRRLSLRLAETEATKRSLEASLTRSLADFKRTQSLIADGFSTQQDLDNIIAERDSLKARISQLSLAADAQRIDVADSVLRAPYDAVVVERLIDPGSTVNVGQPVVRLNATNALDVLVGVPQSIARDLSLNDKVKILNSQSARPAQNYFEGDLVGVSDQVDRATQTVLLRIRLPEDIATSPGSILRVEFAEERALRGAWIPAQALTEGTRGLWSVYVAEEEGAYSKIVRKEVEILHLTDSKVYVHGTLEDGDKVVSSSSFRFVPGQAVKVVSNTTMPTAISLEAGR